MTFKIIHYSIAYKQRIFKLPTLVLVPNNERLKLHYIEQFGFRTYTDKHGDDLLCLRA